MFEEEFSFANKLADRAADIAMRYFRGRFDVRIKPDMTPVTEADLAVEEMFRREVSVAFPSDVVVGEEHGIEDGERRWVIDPIDGTKNFTDGVPIWGTLIALHVEGRGALGIASAPALGERYAAVHRGGATCNGEPISVATRPLAGSFFIYSSAESWLDKRRPAFEALLRGTRRNRGFGDFWGHMLVARGAADIMAEPELRIWDWAAVQVIVEEAGGRMTTFEGGPLSDGSSALTTSAAIHDEVVELLSGAV
jgi:histidinol-phosphatase